ncbi:ComEA family DNA-binding protein [Flavobacterium sp. 3HN19-14]|uniref:ComEA family DNA-binding protein n=1 Tax=Flavobacterium sp. 3HN19-14 TaxID=3448133 RepID=UPI003EDEB7C4
MKSFLQSYFAFTKAQRSGLFLLFAIIISLQLFYYFADFTAPEPDSPEKWQWLSLQTEIDSLKEEKKKVVPKIYPFNPNFITDFKGYKLGMSTAEIDRLLAFREKNLYVNSAEDFQNVTKVSDSLLSVISPYFKFPDWVKNKKSSNYKAFPKKNFEKKKEKIVVHDINDATQDDLIKIYGIGPALSERILKEKLKFGAFASMEQMNDIWGLSPEVIENLNKYFKIINPPKIEKLKINDASIKELAKFPYFRYALAKQIVTYRSMNGGIHTSEDLIKINGFPVEKVKIIALYLEF